MKLQQIISEILKIREITKDHNKMINVFSDDEGKKALSELNRTMSRLSILLKAQYCKELAHPTNEVIRKPIFRDSGCLVSIRPVQDEYKGKTFLGFLIGDVARGSSLSISDDKIQCEWSGYNPAIYVPELEKIIYGYESWWGEIKSEDDFKKISDDDIQNTWYVKLWRDLND